MSPATAASNLIKLFIIHLKCALKDFHQWKESRNGQFEQLEEL